MKNLILNLGFAPILVICSVSLVQAASYSGKSEAELKTTSDGAATMNVKNTNYQFDDFPYRFPGAGSFSTVILYEIKKELSLPVGGESDNADFTVTAYDPKNGKKLWTIQEKAFEFTPTRDYFVVRTSLGGDCKTSNRLFDKMTGKYLLSYSFAQAPTQMPIVLRAGAFEPNGFRFLAYRDNYWSCGKDGKFEDPSGQLTLAGVISYATPQKVIQKVALFYDAKAMGDPSDDPESIEMQYQDHVAKFLGSKGAQPYEFDFWWHKPNTPNKPNEVGDRIYSEINAKLVFGNYDSITIPIDNDRLVIKKAKLGKFFKKLVEIPEKDWDKF